MLNFLAALFFPGCGGKEPALTPEAQIFKQEIRRRVQEMRESLTGPTAAGDIIAIDAALQGFAGQTARVVLCVDCPYKSAVLNKSGVLLSTYPKNESVGRNFSSYRIVSDPLKKHIITQSQAFLADGTKMYFISAPLIQNNKAVGVAVMSLSPVDLKKWHLEEPDFLAMDFNIP
jgi:hypothetical protein